MNFLKARVSYGVTGNEAKSATFNSRRFVSALPYADQSGIAPDANIGNPNLSWETTKQVDLGVEFGFLNNRISGEVDLYQKNTTGLLLNRQLQLASGYTTITENVGALRNKGLEISLNGRILDGDFKWSVGVTYRSTAT
ncbi:MAG: TonB-dependent receptor [Hymenobacter sp.]